MDALLCEHSNAICLFCIVSRSDRLYENCFFYLFSDSIFVDFKEKVICYVQDKCMNVVFVLGLI